MGLFKSEIVVTPNIVGVGDGSAASAGDVGELIFSSVAIGSASGLTTATAANVLTLSLTPGDWEVSGNVNFTAASATTAAGTLWEAGVSIVSATLPTDGTEVQKLSVALTTTSFKDSLVVPAKRISLTSNASVYLVAEGTFSAGTVGGYGHLHARRVR